ncbi:hypothetical protein MKW94_017210 [Papaver nudicaule]|uniref:Uncharacterized protein n=1 Tax=Papaver nudicaule TaxID=74823 RepID=A0AA41VIU4_PAPNU|nr:hypothetical protein [Papaver nudicaule]
MAPYCCNGTRTILSNQVLGSQSSYLEMNDRAPKIDKDSKENVDSSSLSNERDELCLDILLWLRTAALNPCKQKAPLEKLMRRQILKAREHISVSTTEFPWKQRKLDLLQKRSGVSPLAKPIEQSSFASSVPCLINSTHPTERSQQCLCKPSISVGSLRYCNDLSRKRVRNSPFYESGDSISVASTPKKPNLQNMGNQPLKESNGLPLTQVCMPQAKITNNFYFSPLSNSDDSSVSSENSQEKHKTARRSPRLQNFTGDYLPRIEVPDGTRHQADILPQAKITNENFSPLSNPEESVDNSSTSSENSQEKHVNSSMSSNNSQEKHKAARRSPRLQNFIGDYLPRIEVPVGTRHQAVIPDYIGPRKSDNSSANGQSDFLDSRYLGTKIWPIEGKNTEDSEGEGIGKGRSDSCSCYSKGCGGCIKLHVFKKGLQLREDLGTAFFTWKFDEMGEEVAKSWTAAEQQCFETLVKTDPLSQTDNFLEPALKRFSGKCKKVYLVTTSMYLFLDA